MNQLELIKKWYDLKDPEKSINDFCNEKNISLSREEKTKLLSNLIEEDVILYSSLLVNSIPLIADVDDVFLEFLKKIEQATHVNLSPRWFKAVLIAVGKNNHDLGIELATKTKNSTSPFDFSTAFLGGVGYSNYFKIEEIVNDLFLSDDPKEIVRGLKIIKIAFDKKQLENNSNIFSKIEIAVKINNEIINLESTYTLLKFYDLNSNFCQALLLQLAKSNDVSKNMILRYLRLHPIKNSTDAIALIQECITVENSNVMSLVFYALGNYTKTNYKEIMDIIRSALENKVHLSVPLEFLIKKLGKNALLSSLDEFENWLGTDNFYLEFFMPKFIAILIPNGQKQSCFLYFEKWLNNNSIPQEIFLKIYKKVLASCYKNNPDQEFIQNSKKLLSQLVSNSNINSSFILKDEHDEILQCARLIKGLEYYSCNLNYNRILSNLDLFPNLKNLLTTTWISTKKQENNRTNLLLRVLERELLDDSKINTIVNDIEKAENTQESVCHRFELNNYTHNFLYLWNIEQNIQSFKNANLNVNSHFRKKLQNDEQVNDTISEINILGLLAEHYKLKLEAPVGKKNIDSLIEIDGQKLYLEVLNPSEFSPLELFDGEVFTIDNRAKNKILDKCEGQLAQIPENDIPAVIAIDIQGSDVDVYSITDALYGSLQYTSLTDKETGEECGGYSSLKNNSIHKTKPISDVLSGVLCFNSEMLSDMKLHIVGNFIPNPNAKNPLTSHLIKRIEEVIIKLEK